MNFRNKHILKYCPGGSATPTESRQQLSRFYTSNQVTSAGLCQPHSTKPAVQLLKSSGWRFPKYGSSSIDSRRRRRWILFPPYPIHATPILCRKGLLRMDFLPMAVRRHAVNTDRVAIRGMPNERRPFSRVQTARPNESWKDRNFPRLCAEFNALTRGKICSNLTSIVNAMRITASVFYRRR